MCDISFLKVKFFQLKNLNFNSVVGGQVLLMTTNLSFRVTIMLRAFLMLKKDLTWFLKDQNT